MQLALIGKLIILKMRISILNFVILVGIGFLAWLATFILECYYQRVANDKVSQEEMRLRGHQAPFPGGTNDNIFWLLQISDIHLSYYFNKDVGTDLLSFCTDTLDVIKPSLVLATGDLTHAKFPGERYSQQFEEEWTTYKSILETCRVKERVPWLDMRGNHDNFDVLFHSDKSNRFRKYSMSWKHHGSKSYLYTHNTSFGAYSFIGMDACPSPGPRRPYNFFGILHDEDLLALSKLSFLASRHSNHTVWFSHYPSATITTSHHYELRQLMSTSVAHICGHLHTLGNFVHQMYGHHPGGHLELELGDFIWNRRYRLLVFDHDLFSFKDTSLNKWPLVLITNPKDAKFTLPSREPLGRMLRSTHVRLLTFSPHPITSLKALVDGKPLSLPPLQEMAVGGGPLYALPWTPDIYQTGLHQIEVEVKDAAGGLSTASHFFSLDGSTLPLQPFPEFLLLTDIRSLLRMEFLFLWLTLLASLLLSWLSNGPTSYFYPLLRDKVIFYSLLTYLVYFGVGPWYLGEVLTGVYGLISVHGVYVSGHFLPGSMTYLHGILQVILFQLPLVYYLNHVMSHDHRVTDCKKRSCRCFYHVIIVLAFIMQCLITLTILPYGTIALVLCPGVTWSIPLALVLIWRAFRRNRHPTIT